MLEVRKADVYYGNKQVLYDINIKLEKGVYGLIGENGAGKTTLISLITGLLSAKKGSVIWDGSDIKKLGRSYYNYIGYLPQFPSLYGEFYPMEFLLYMASLKNIHRKEAVKLSEELLGFVGLADEKKKKISQFSGGMRQRLGIAQALLNKPRLLILDEPTAGLDPKERIRFRNIITELSKDKTVLLATHIISDIENIAKEVIFLNKGKIIKKDKADNLIQEIDGTVFEAVVDNITYDTIDKNILSNVAERNGGYEVRGFIRNVKDSKQVKPNLEDVFLHYIGNGERDDKVRI